MSGRVSAIPSKMTMRFFTSATLRTMARQPQGEMLLLPRWRRAREEFSLRKVPRAAVALASMDVDRMSSFLSVVFDKRAQPKSCTIHMGLRYHRCSTAQQNTTTSTLQCMCVEGGMRGTGQFRHLGNAAWVHASHPPNRYWSPPSLTTYRSSRSDPIVRHIEF